ncbi:nucleotide-binding protein, putative [Bodo saltans]|uniref:Cytosolic Fe-S cluster assembly factor NUBP1 homolog n=1 Tax=Bodo saltans TaxID=75058 RepID=A0A0S4JE42_BODSA|nr:nucleotide-binding protein, putative [Bodo saltans]|eukprot:CUG89844.1 nucleotide-binding protein, putative [Bodo saltans]
MSTSELSNPDGHCVGPQSEQAGKAASCQGCPNAAICASAPKGPDPDIEIITRRLQNVKHKILVLSGKGGVGKSTMTKELAFTLGHRNLLVGLVDTDICGPSIPRMTGVRAEEVHQSAGGWEPVAVDDNVSVISTHFLLPNKDDAVVWRGPRKNGMIKNFLKDVSWGELDVLVFDTPPGTSDEHISTVTLLQQSGGVSGAVIVTTPQEVAVADVRREISFCIKTKVPILGIVENMSGFVCPKCDKSSMVFPSKFGEGAGERLAKEYGFPFLGRVPLDPRLMKACEEGVPLREIASDSPAVIALDRVVDGLLHQLSLQSAPNASSA